MLSEDYKERFKAEYYQLVNRYEGLKLMLKRYIVVLELRASTEKIDLSK